MITTIAEFFELSTDKREFVESLLFNFMSSDSREEFIDQYVRYNDLEEIYEESDNDVYTLLDNLDGEYVNLITELEQWFDSDELDEVLEWLSNEYCYF